MKTINYKTKFITLALLSTILFSNVMILNGMLFQEDKRISENNILIAPKIAATLSVSVTPTSASKTYGSTQTFTYTLYGSSDMNNGQWWIQIDGGSWVSQGSWSLIEDPHFPELYRTTVSYTSSSSLPIGNHVVHARFYHADSGYVYKDASITITAFPLSVGVSPTSASKTYGSTQTFTYTLYCDSDMNNGQWWIQIDGGSWVAQGSWSLILNPHFPEDVFTTTVSYTTSSSLPIGNHVVHARFYHASSGYTYKDASITITAIPLSVGVSPTSASITYGSTQTFTYTLYCDSDLNNGQWWIQIDGGSWVYQGSWSLILNPHFPEDVFTTTLSYTTSSSLSIGNHVVHARFYHVASGYTDKDASITIDGLPPSAPINIATSENPCYDGTSIITWTKSSGATKYQLYEAISFSGTYTAIGSQLGDVSSTSVSKTSEQSRYYKVMAGNNYGWSSLSTSFTSVTWLKSPTPSITSPVTQIIYTHSFFTVARNSVGSYVNGFDWEISIDGGAYTDWSTSSSSFLSYDPSAGDHTYRFRLRVRNVNFGVWSNYGYSGIVTVSTPSTPLNFQVSEVVCYDGSVTFSWTATTGATNYILYEATTFDGTYTAIVSGITGTTTTISKSSEQTRYYKIRAINDVGESSYSGFLEVSWLAPESPTIISPVTQTVYTHSSFLVIRDTVGNYVNEYDWEISIDGGAYTDWSTSSLDTLNYDPSTGDHTYQFRLRVRNVDFGVWSDYDESGIITVSTPSTPLNFQVSEVVCYDGSVTFSWTVISGATSYTLYEATTYDGTYTEIESGITGTMATVSKSSEQTRYYKIRAINEVGGSDFSDYVSVSWLAPESPTITSPITQTAYTHSSFSVIRDTVESYVNEYDWEISIDGGTYTDWSASSLDTLSYDPSTGDHTYQFRLRMRNVDFGVWSDYGYSGIVTLSRPSVPINVQTSESICYDGSVLISWNAATGATSYILYEAITYDGTYTAIVSGITGTTAIVSKSSEQTRYYKLKAVNEVGESDHSDYISVSWLAPESPTITSPITEIVYTRETISVIRDTVGSYVNEYDWEISIDGGAYTDWSTSSLDTLSYDPSIGDHTYQFRLRVRNVDFGVWSDYDESGIITVSTSSIPLNVQTSESICYDGSVLISWDEVSDAINYTLYEATTYDGTYTAIESGITGTTTTVSKSSEQTRYYKLKAVNEVGESDYSDYISVAWSVPESPTITSPATQTVYTHSSFSVIRNLVGDYVNEYDWEISVDGGAYTDWSTSSLDTLSYDPSTGDHTYQFRLRIRNVDFGVWSDYGYSGIVTVSTPSTPLNFQTSESICYDGSVLISWDAATGATSYILYEATTFDGTYTAIESGITGTTTTVSKSSEQTRYYKLKAVNEIGESDYSDYISVAWSLPESPTITSPITEIVDNHYSFSVIRDTVGSYVDEYNWEISIDGGAYTDWSTSSLDTLSYDPAEEDNTYQFRLRVRNSEFGVWSDYGYSGILTIILPDTINPLIDSPTDVIYVYSTTGHSINWSVSDSNPYQYQLFIDGIGQGVNVWDGSDLSLNIDGLSIGTHNVTLWVSDIEGNWAQDQVNVFVENNIPYFENGSLIGIFLISVIVSISIVKRKR